MASSDRKQLIKEGLKNDVLRIPVICRHSQKRLTSLLATIDDPKLKMKIRLINNYINIKTERIETYKVFQTDFRNFFRKLLVLVKRDYPAARYEDMISLTDQEIISYLKTGQGISLDQTRKRFNRQYVSLSVNNRMEFLYDQRLIEKIRTTFRSVKAVREIKGNIVSRGRARGRVKIIINKNDLLQFKSGQILVSNFTTPEYVPAIRRAAAIVTDDGGITCHAAVVAREFGKPCVVGTKDATRWLKNGDLVEVDAEKGIIRIIKRARNDS